MKLSELGENIALAKNLVLNAVDFDFAAERARRVVPEGTLTIEPILHPSPASPAANRGWHAAARKQLVAIGFL